MSDKKIGIPLEGFAEFARVAAAEGAVLLKNEDNLLPLKKGDCISIFGRTQINYYRSGTGSGGAVNVLYTTTLLDGLRNYPDIKINEELLSIYEDWVKENPFDNGGGGWAAEPWHQKELLISEIDVKNARDKSEKALIVLGRTAGEDKDNADAEGSYQLTKDERQLLKTVTTYFENVIVLLNVSNIIDMNWVNHPDYQNRIKAILYAWHGGMEGGNAIGDVLTGKVTPSGKLPDTIAYNIGDYPSTLNFGNEVKNIYQEDIYVGYRYFETFHPEKVQYEFGFGLSYTEFKINDLKADKLIQNNKDVIQITANVTNIGNTYSGKETLQVYFEAPQGVLGKPKKSLIAFTKTNELKPNETQSIAITFPIEQMASYDDGGCTGHKSCYLLEAGKYIFHIGNSVKNTQIVPIGNESSLTIDELIIVKQLEEVMAPTESFTCMKPGVKKPNGTYEITYVDVSTRTVDMDKRIQDNLPETIKQTGNKGIKLKDVSENKASMKDFIAQLSDHELSVIVRGEGMSPPKVTPGTASAFGGISSSLFEYGISLACTADGPSGVRMESGLKATQLPIGTLLASTWNTVLMEELYIMEGKELLRNEIDTLLGPGINLHRNPMNGRNFEYYSEDPYLTGSFAAAAVSGIKKGGSHSTLKHFACNSQEKQRHQIDAVLSERALRELYLRGFEMAVATGDSFSIMTAYNPINGHWAASNYDLNTTVLRKEWGFKGIVMTDWWAQMNDPVTAGKQSKQYTNFMIRSQNDLYMVINNNGAEINSLGDNTIESLENGTLTIGELQRCATNICNFIMHAPVFLRKQDVLEQITAFAPSDTLPNEYKDNLQLLSDDSKIKPLSGKPTYIQVDNEGPFTIIVRIMSPESNLAQSTCNITINDELLTTVQTNGTDGNWITQRLLKISLSKGYYALNFEHVKPGIQMEWIDFSR